MSAVLDAKDLKVGDYIKIIEMSGEPYYLGRKGTVEHIDDAGGVHGTWGGLALLAGDVVLKLDGKEDK